ncbi:hypothetical protein [Microlunatus parietis]|uniref:1-acyl-sn-glycerol-3-phosphate acyltransferase n=1 Tax=Microlunatus parietis TaxID=682979 RepID=A0A7Y9I2Q5_9ACTN|nr:hypothetical protein [Microlunatus parietis]NYE69157.1 hypothetical protein [Microlunatus parietis]
MNSVAGAVEVAYQTLLRPALRAGLALETYGSAELRDRTGPLVFLVGDGSRADRQLAVAGLPRSLRRRTVPVADAGQAPGLLDRDWNVVATADQAIAAIAARFRVPIIPVGVRGSVAAIEPGRIRPVPGRPRVVLRYGTPLEPRVGEAPLALAARTVEAIDALVAEDAATWWTVRRRQADGLPAAAEAPAVRGWRRTWQQTEPPLLGGPRPGGRIWQR